MRLPAVAADFSRYAQILERRPFASAAADVVTPAVVTLVEAPAFVKDLRMCAITESPAGLQVGFVNIQVKPPQPYYLYVGDSEDGIELVAADYDKEGVLLRKDAEQYWLYMSDNIPTVPDTPRGPATHSPGQVHPGAPSGPRGAQPTDLDRPSSRSDSGSATSYADRRRKRLEEMRQRATAAQKLSDEDVEKRLQEYQMDLIRKGLTPLPIPLTEEMDSKLVKEGVLPPVAAEPVE